MVLELALAVKGLKENGNITSDSYSKSTIINDHLTSIFINDNSNLPDLGISPYPHLPHITVSRPGVFKLLSTLNPNKASGPDDLSAKLISTLANELTPAITSLFQQSFDSGIFPTKFKEANITPIHKKGPKSNKENYRPISLTNILSKSFEHIFASNLMKHLEHNNILTDFQHGFRKSRSTVSQLLTTCHDLAIGLNQNTQTDGILLDFSKAFDRVSHKRLLHKLNFYGVRDRNLEWAKSFLSDRLQRVVIDGVPSSYSNVISGVPQGTVLGPIFFLCFINDLPDPLSSNIRLFADDAFLYRQIHSIADHKILQHDLDLLSKWSSDWLLDFNSSKCFVLSTTLKTKPSNFSYKLNNVILDNVKNHPYLGVILDNKLTFTPHINHTAAKATKSLNFLSRNISHCPPSIKNAAYNIYMSAPNWSMPHLFGHHLPKLTKPNLKKFNIELAASLLKITIGEKAHQLT